MSEELKKAHTGEHTLFQSLSRVFEGIEVEKIDITEGRKSLFVKYPGVLDWKKVLEAELLVNKIITEGKVVKKTVGPLDEIKNKFGNKLRGKWDRITDKTVTVVEVDGFDCAACSGEHVSNTKEIGMLLVTKVNSLGKNVYEIQFEVDEKAKKKAIEMSSMTLTLVDVLGASEDNIEKTATNLKEEVLRLKKLVKAITKDYMNNFEFENVKGVKLYAKSFSELDSDEIGKSVGEMVEGNKTVVAVVNEHLGNISIILARSKDLDINVLTTLKEVCKEFNAKCGGKEDFAMGGGIKVEKEQVIQKIKDKLTSCL